MVDPLYPGSSVLIEEIEYHNTVVVIYEVTAVRSLSIDLSSLSWSNLLSEQIKQGTELLQKHSTILSQGERPGTHRTGGA